MNIEDYRWRIPQYLSGELNAGELAGFEAFLETSSELRAEVEELRRVWHGLALLPQEEPGANLRARFYQRLNSLDRAPARTTAKASWTGWGLPSALQFGVAAIVIFAVGYFAGHTTNASRTADDIAHLRGEVQSMRETVALSLLQRSSANARLEGVSWTSRVDRPDLEVSSALLTALNHDPNVNVRLSSVNALEAMTSDETIRKAMIDSIATQESPLVQITLIDALVQSGDRSVANELTTIAKGEQFNPSVRQRASWGIQKLGIQ